MDDFLKDIHTVVFKKWILIQESNQYSTCLDTENDSIICIETDFGQGQITFNPLNIIELKVINKMNKETEFYLHFQMKNIKHAIHLFHEMIESIMNLVSKPKTKVLLSCSGGFTTSYFSNKISEVVKLLGLELEISSVGYSQLYQDGKEYDIILLAPQISYLYAKVQEILTDQIIMKIPPQVFAKYDAGRMITIILDAIKNKNKKRRMKATPPLLKMNIKSQEEILCLSVSKNKDRIHIAYRLYQNGDIVLENKTIKYHISIQDIFDVLNTIILQYPGISIIGVSIPGIINDGLLSSSYISDVEENQIVKAFQSKYKQKIIISNDINAAAVGYYATQSQYHSIMFLFQPISIYAGAGFIVNGQIICGSKNLAGEVKYLPTQLSDEQLTLSQTPEGTLELVSKTIVTAMCIINPEAIVLYSDLIPNILELKKEMEKLIPETFIPEIIKVDNLLEYILLGQMIICSQ